MDPIHSSSTLIMEGEEIVALSPPTTRTVHVAYVSPTSNLYGSERSLLETLRTMNRKKFISHLVTVTEGPLEETARAEGVEVVRFPWLQEAKNKRPVQWLIGIVRFAKWLRSSRIDILELNLLWFLDLGLLAVAARLAGAKFIIRVRITPTPSWLSLYNRFCLSQADRIISVAERSAAPLRQKHGLDFLFPIRSERMRIIPSGRNVMGLPKALSEREIVRSLGVPDHGRIVGMVAAIEPRKRQDLFLKAARIIHEHDSNVWFVIVGGLYGNRAGHIYQEELHRLATAGKISERIIFTGYRSDALRLMKHFNVLVLPSELEGLSGVLIEAMALGVPVVASQTDGTPEIVTDGVTGLLVGDSDAKAYAQSVLRLLNDSKLATELCAAAREKVNQFDTSRVTHRLESCYEEVLRCA